MKACAKCGVVKALGEFYPNTTAKSGISAVCKACTRLRSAARNKRAAPQLAEQRAERRREHQEWLKSEDGARNQAMRDERRRLETSVRHAMWYAENKDRVYQKGVRLRRLHPDRFRANCRNYQQRKRGAIPPWATVDGINLVYLAAAIVSRETGSVWEVDHVVPLRHPLVCGLHCESNLQLLPARENRSKGNRYWPGMPE